MVEVIPNKILSLPDEVIQSILSYLPPQQTLLVQRACRRFASVASEPRLWRQYCISSFRWWDKSHRLDGRLRNPWATDWRKLYADRHRTSDTARRLLDALIQTETRRVELLQCIIALGYDVKHVLLDAFHTAKSSDNYLAQRYWSHAALGCLHRTVALEQWLNLKHGEEVSDATERLFCALDLFIIGERLHGDVDDILSDLDGYVASIRAAHPAIDTQTPRQKAITIAEHLLSHNWTGIQGERHYHSLDHLFLGVSVSSDNRNSVPLISAIIYCYIARRFDLDASPISYPFHVHACVQAPPGIDLDGNPYTPSTDFITDSSSPVIPSESITLYMDPFATSNPITQTHLLTQLRFIAPRSTPTQISKYLTPSTPRDLTIRAALNILSAPQHYSGPPLFPISQPSATYAALFALVMLPPSQHPAQLRQHLAVLAQHFLEHFDLDVHIFETYVLPLTATLPDANAYRSLMQNLRETDTIPRPAKRRFDAESGAETENNIVKFKVGQVFRHRRRGFVAVIYGWDPYCRMQEEWIAMNLVDRLSRGRGQPFYNVLVEDESTRYVAEENIIPLHLAVDPSPDVALSHEPEMTEEEVIDRFPIEIGKWFRRFDAEKGVFISNVKGEYPDD